MPNNERTSYTRTLKMRVDDFDAFLDAQILKCRETDLTPEKRAERKKLVKENPANFGKIYYSNIFELEDSKLHTTIDALRSGEWYVSGHRESGKTARTIIQHIIYRIAVVKSGLIGYNCRIPTLAKNRIAAIIRMLQRDKMLQYDWGVKFQRTSSEYAIINNVHLLASGCKTGLRANLTDDFKRFDVIVSDDLTDRQSGPADKQAAIDFLKAEVKGQLNKNGLAIALFNDSEPDSPGVILREEFPERSIVFPALNKDGQSNWPEYRTTEEWEEFRKTCDYVVWMGDYQCNPIKNGKNFEINWFNFTHVRKNDIIASMTAIDPARGSSPSACFKAAITMGIRQDKKCIVLDLWIRKERYENMFRWIAKNINRWPNWKACSFENDFNQWELAKPYYDHWRENSENGLPIIKHEAKQLKTDKFGSDKDSRILNLVMPMQDNEILFADHLKGSKEFEILKHQLLSFGAGKEKLDGPDAMATAFIQLPRYIRTGTFQAVKEKVFSKTRFGKGFV